MRKICRKYGCDNVATENGYCDNHQEDYKRYKQERESKRFTGKRTASAKWNYLYRTKRWKELRERVLKAGGYKCKRCGATTNLIVHHVFEWSTEAEFFNGLYEVVCKSCHSKDHQNNKKGYK